jgi:hypothetical protein
MAKWSAARKAEASRKAKERIANGAVPFQKKAETVEPAAAESEPITVPVPEGIGISTGIPPPEFKDELATPPSLFPPPPGSKPGTPAKKKWWVKDKPTAGETGELTDAFSSLIQDGYAGLAELRDYQPWVHSEAQMKPYRVIIRQLLKRLEFDPSMLLIILSLLQIAEQEGKTAYGDIKAHRERKQAQVYAAPPGDAPIQEEAI